MPLMMPIVLCLALKQKSNDLEVPVRIKVGEELIDVEAGHAAPLLVDWDGDGLDDLLVGQFGGGKLLIFKNQGTFGHPLFTKSIVFQAGGEAGIIPSD